MAFAGKTAFITGASRGIGAEIAKALARRGANVVVAAKSAEPHKTLPGTIHTVVDELREIAAAEKNGAQSLAVQVDVRDERAVEDAFAQTTGKFGGVDMLVNNASAITLKDTVEATPKNYDLINTINARGTWLVSRTALPHLRASGQAQRNPHILTLSPPLDQGMFSRDPTVGAFPDQFAYTRALYAMSKFAMSVASFSLSAENMRYGVASNTLWPYTMIGTSAMRIVNPKAGAERTWRSPEILADAAVRIMGEDAKKFTGRFVIDELYLRKVHGFTHEQIAAYSLGGPETPLDQLAEDLFISQEIRDAVMALRH